MGGLSPSHHLTKAACKTYKKLYKRVAKIEKSQRHMRMAREFYFKFAK